MRQLGELETRIMHVLWRRGRPATVKDVQVHLAPKRELAYTTVMTVMDRLWRKGLLHRERRGRPFHYTPAVSEAEYTAGVMRRVLGSSRDRKGVLAHFVRGMSRSDEAELLRLADEANERRRP